MGCAYCEEHGLEHQTSWGSWLPGQSRHMIMPKYEQLALFNDRRRKEDSDG